MERVKSYTALLLRVALVLAVMAIAVYKVADQIYWREVQEQRLAFLERHGAVDFRDFIPERPAAENDAGRIYHYAAMTIARVNQEHGDWSPFKVMVEGPEGFRTGSDDEAPLPTARDTAAMAESKMAALDAIWPVLRKADDKDAGRLLHFDPTTKMAPELNEIREIAQLMAAKALQEARDGNIGEACRWLESGMHLADLLRAQPTMAVLMVRIGCLQSSADAFEAVTDVIGGAPPVRPGYFEAWERAAAVEGFVWSLASESVFSWSIEMPFDYRLQRSLFVLKTAKYFERIETVMAAPEPGRLGALGRFEDEIERAGKSDGIAEPMTLGLIRAAEIFCRVPEMRDRVMAAADAADGFDGSGFQP